MDEADLPNWLAHHDRSDWEHERLSAEAVAPGNNVANEDTQPAAPASDATLVPTPRLDIRYSDPNAAVGATNRRRDDDLMAKIHKGQVAGRALNSDAVGLLPEFTPLPLVADDEIGRAVVEEPEMSGENLLKLNVISVGLLLLRQLPATAAPPRVGL